LLKSLFFKENPDRQVAECFSESGDLYMTLGHHGPAIENEFFGLRMFFDKKAAMDVPTWLTDSSAPYI
tara:strand:- start:1364 stop:1567 length:204 start_codon:yes stop_codon:yes gene_type:complete